MLEEIEREFEGIVSQFIIFLGSKLANIYASEEILSLFNLLLAEAIKGLQQIKSDDSRNIEEQCKLFDLSFLLFTTFSCKF